MLAVGSPAVERLLQATSAVPIVFLRSGGRFCPLEDHFPLVFSHRRQNMNRQSVRHGHVHGNKFDIPFHNSGNKSNTARYLSLGANAVTGNELAPGHGSAPKCTTNSCSTH